MANARRCAPRRRMALRRNCQRSVASTRRLIAAFELAAVGHSTGRQSTRQRLWMARRGLRASRPAGPAGPVVHSAEHERSDTGRRLDFALGTLSRASGDRQLARQQPLRRRPSERCCLKLNDGQLAGSAKAVTIDGIGPYGTATGWIHPVPRNPDEREGQRPLAFTSAAYTRTTELAPPFFSALNVGGMPGGR